MYVWYQNKEQYDRLFLFLRLSTFFCFYLFCYLPEFAHSRHHYAEIDRAFSVHAHPRCLLPSQKDTGPLGLEAPTLHCPQQGTPLKISSPNMVTFWCMGSWNSSLKIFRGHNSVHNRQTEDRYVKSFPDSRERKINCTSCWRMTKLWSSF